MEQEEEEKKDKEGGRQGEGGKFPSENTWKGREAGSRPGEIPRAAV